MFSRYYFNTRHRESSTKSMMGHKLILYWFQYFQNCTFLKYGSQCLITESVASYKCRDQFTFHGNIDGVVIESQVIGNIPSLIPTAPIKIYDDGYLINNLHKSKDNRRLFWMADFDCVLIGIWNRTGFEKRFCLFNNGVRSIRGFQSSRAIELICS